MNIPAEAFDTDVLLDNMTTAIVALDETLTITALNTAAEQLLGLSANRVLGKRISQVITIPDSLFARLREALELNQPVNDRQVSLEPFGAEPILVDCSISPYQTSTNSPALLMELAGLDRTLRIVRDEAMAAQQESVKSLLRGLAHEIKNPLGGLRGAAQLLERQLHDEELTEYTHIIIQEADRLHSLIDRMLGPNSRPRRDEVNIHEVLEHVRKISSVSTASSVSINYDYDPSIPEFFSDRDRLVQVFLNIVGNALEAVKDEGLITLSTRITSNFTIAGKLHPLVAVVSIRDDGPGIPDTLLEQIFYPMVTGKGASSGLGLSIAQAIMGQLGGIIECQSEPGNTTFTVMIPMDLT